MLDDGLWGGNDFRNTHRDKTFLQFHCDSLYSFLQVNTQGPWNALNVSNNELQMILQLLRMLWNIVVLVEIPSSPRKPNRKADAICILIPTVQKCTNKCGYIGLFCF
jgi:hypothetical protein